MNIFRFLACCSLAIASGLAQAEHVAFEEAEPLRLTNQQMDTVAAGLRVAVIAVAEDGNLNLALTDTEAESDRGVGVGRVVGVALTLGRNGSTRTRVATDGNGYFRGVNHCGRFHCVSAVGGGAFEVRSRR